MQKKKHTSRARFYNLFLQLVVLWLNCPVLSFAQPKQQSLSFLRERSGQALQSNAAGEPLQRDLTRQEISLLGRIKEAGREGRWSNVGSDMRIYKGNALPIYVAGMRAAFRCDKYEEGAAIFEKCKESCQDLNAPFFSEALNIFRKLRQWTEVRSIWNDSLGCCKLNEILALGRITAAADEGDVETAAEVLDLMNSTGVAIRTNHLSSAIRACWGWGKSQHKAARYFFDLFDKLGVEPNVISFTTLVGAFSTADLKDIREAFQKMKGLQIQPNHVFAETYLLTLFHRDERFPSARSRESLLTVLKEKPVDRLREARQALVNFDEAGVKLTNLCEKIRSALKSLPE